MIRHRAISMISVYFATDTHTFVTLATEKLIFGLSMILTISKIEDRFLTQRLAFMFAWYFIFVVLKVTIFAEIGFFSEAVMSS